MSDEGFRHELECMKILIRLNDSDNPEISSIKKDIRSIIDKALSHDFSFECQCHSCVLKKIKNVINKVK